MREPDRIIRLKTVLARTGLSRSTIYRKIAEGTFHSRIMVRSESGRIDAKAQITMNLWLAAKRRHSWQILMAP